MFKKESFWRNFSIALSVLLILSLLTGGFNLFGGVSKEEARLKTLNYINTVLQGKETVTVDNVVKEGNLYKMDVHLGNDLLTSYITKDGKLLFPNAVELDDALSLISSSTTKETEIPKTSKPKIEAFIFSYCPYGIQYQKGLLPVVELLKDKIDVNVLFMGAMHGLYEEVENKRQICIREEQPDKYWDYVKYFVNHQGIGACVSKYYGEFNRDYSKLKECLEQHIDECLDKANIDNEKLAECMKKVDDYYNKDKAVASSYGITGSPTALINGVSVSGRSPEVIKNALCSAFKDEPKECLEKLSSATPSPGFGESSSSSTGSC